MLREDRHLTPGRSLQGAEGPGAISGTARTVKRSPVRGTAPSRRSGGGSRRSAGARPYLPAGRHLPAGGPAVCRPIREEDATCPAMFRFVEPDLPRRS